MDKQIVEKLSREQLIFLGEMACTDPGENSFEAISSYFLKKVCHFLNFSGALIFFPDSSCFSQNLFFSGKLEEISDDLHKFFEKREKEFSLSKNCEIWSKNSQEAFSHFWEKTSYTSVLSRNIIINDKEDVVLKFLSDEKHFGDDFFLSKALGLFKTALENVLKFRNREIQKELENIRKEVLSVISASLTDDTGDILKFVLEKIGEFVRFHQASMALFNEGSHKLKFLSVNENMENSFDAWIDIPVSGTVSGLIYKEGSPLLINRLKDYECFSMSSVMESSRYFHSCVGVPVYSSGKIAGSFILWNKEEKKYSARDLSVIKSVSGLITVSINSLKVHNDARERAAALSALMQVGETLSSTMDLDKLSRSVIEELDKVISIPYAGLYLYDEDKNILHLVDAKGVEGEERRISGENMMSRHPGWVIRNKEVLLANDAANDERVHFPITGKKEYKLPASLCYVPMLYQDKCFGIIGLASTKKNYFTPYHVKLVTAAARNVAIAFSRVRMYEKEKEMVNKLKDVNKMKDQFIANVSHELRTPLTAVIGFSYLLQGGKLGKLSEMQQELINDILTSAQNMLHLVEDLLDLSKLQAKKIKLLKKCINLKPVVEEVITTTKIIAQDMRVKVEGIFDGDFTSVYVDPNRMRQIILNLVTNAIKFNVENGVVRIFLQDRGAEIVIKVEDTGVGISEEDKAKVFEQFRQFGIGNKKFRGTGLGLAITKQLVELHGGEISLESEPGKGTTFTIILPREEGRISEPEENGLSVKNREEKEMKPFRSLISEKKKHTILLVEDDKYIRKMIQALFEDKFEFIVACDGIEGVEKALRYIPDLILMDLALPYMNGYETTAIIKKLERTSHIPIIALTARVTEAEMDKAALFSFDKIINKPFDPDRLISQIIDFLSRN